MDFDTEGMSMQPGALVSLANIGQAMSRIKFKCFKNFHLRPPILYPKFYASVSPTAIADGTEHIPMPDAYSPHDQGHPSVVGKSTGNPALHIFPAPPSTAETPILTPAPNSTIT